jgi:hypothetical protein
MPSTHLQYQFAFKQKLAVLEEEQAVLSNKNKIISLKKGSKWTY